MTAIRSVCVYCGSSQNVPEQHRRAARRLGQILAEAGVTLVYGGGRVGLMGIIADATLRGGGQVIGIIPKHLVEAEAGHGGVTELHIVENMHERKRMMFDRSDGFAVLPGGIGTLDETFEMMSWRQLQLHDKPIVLVNEGGYWTPLLDLINEMVTVGYAKPAHLKLLTVVEQVDDVLDALHRAPEPVISPAVKWF